MLSASDPDPLRRSFVTSLLIGAIAAPFTAPLFAATDTNRIEVWTSPSCGCRKDWVEHLQANGFEVKVHDGDNSGARTRLGIPVRYGSCHTAEVDGFAIEGHVPATDVRRLLNERPAAIGLSVPAMPRGTPGMDGPAYGGISLRRPPYRARR
jgi:hypothetical protein